MQRSDPSGPSVTGGGRRRFVWVLASAAVLALIAGESGLGEINTVQVKALWYGQATDGSVVSGVTPVDIAARFDDPKTPLSLDVGGLQAAGAGPMWTAATAVAEVQAVLIAGVDPRLVQVNYSLQEAIDGPSAGGLLSVGSLAVIRGSSISETTTMTGTVLPDGSVGPVSGVAAKVRAAGAAGFSRVLVPVGPAFDLETGAEVDLAELGRSIGVNVTPVNSVPHAYALLTGSPEAPSARTPPPIAPGVLQMLARRSRALIDATTPQLEDLSRVGDQSTEAASRNIRAWLGAAEQALGQDDPVLAFTAAAEAAQAAGQTVASARLRTAAQHTSLAERAAQVRRDAAQSLAAIRADVRATAETPVTKIAQLAALPDVLAWGIFAMTAIHVAQDRLATVGGEAELDEIVRFVEAARFEATTYMPATAEALQFIGTTSIADVEATVGLLDAYTDLIAYAADANRVYASSLQLAPGPDSYLGQLIEESDALTETAAVALQGLRGPTAGPALRMAAALLEYVETTQLVNDLASPRSERTSGLPNEMPIKDPATVFAQASTAREIARSQVQAIAAAGLDPSYLQWNSRWGEQLAFGRLPGTTEEQTLHGLEYQWFAVLQSRLLIALSDP